MAHKAGILKTPDELQGAVIKGVGRDYDWKLLAENLVEGRVIQYSDTAYANEIIVSRIISQKLNLKLNDEVLMYFVQNPPRVRKLKIVGVYETNLEEFDNQLVLGDIGLPPVVGLGPLGLQAANKTNATRTTCRYFIQIRFSL